MLALAPDLSNDPRVISPTERCRTIRQALIAAGVYDTPEAEAPSGAHATTWRIAPDPLLLSSEELAFFQTLGQDLLSFSRALNTLYFESVRGVQPPWAAAYLDQGKPESLVAYSRMKRFRDLVPGVIRPDIIPTDHGMVITELDSVPGGIGLTGALAQAYSGPASGGRGSPMVGGTDGIVQGFARMIQDVAASRPGCVAIVVSEEAKEYRPEMTWLAARLESLGLQAYCVGPRDVRFTEEGLWLTVEGHEHRIAVVYRFFELFDLKNIPKAELIMYSAKKGHVAVTPPFKPALEEKLAFALLHHPRLAGYWEASLGERTFADLRRLMPRTWVLDPRPIPPTAVIPGLSIGGRPAADWRELAALSQKERRYVVKPSGFSELAWGSRGVSVGHDLPQPEWAAAIDAALTAFPASPYIVQEFHKGRQFDLTYHDPERDEMIAMPGRARLSPYYFVIQGKAELAGILATVCSLDKKVIHGMRDAVMVPCAIRDSDER
ncbi:hypothetical protein [Candidatus Nitrospira bockiana]